jgi:hypothetical protein
MLTGLIIIDLGLQKCSLANMVKLNLAVVFIEVKIRVLSHRFCGVNILH